MLGVLQKGRLKHEAQGSPEEIATLLFVCLIEEIAPFKVSLQRYLKHWSHWKDSFDHKQDCGLINLNSDSQSGTQVPLSPRVGSNGKKKRKKGTLYFPGKETKWSPSDPLITQACYPTPLLM